MDCGTGSSKPTFTYSASALVYLGEIENRVAEKAEWTSRSFQSSNDAEGIVWKVQLYFGAEPEDPNSLSVFLKHMSYRTVKLISGKISFQDTDGREIKVLAFNPCRIPPKRGIGFKKALRLDQLPTVPHCIYGHELKLECSVTYEGNPAFPTDVVGVDPNLMNDITAYLKSSLGNDVTFVVGDTKIGANKAFLSARSIYFKRMFESGMKEAIENEVRIEDIDADVFKAFIKFLYFGVIPFKSNYSAQNLLPVADRYEALFLKTACETELINTLTPSNVCNRLVASFTYDCKELYGKCLEYVKEHLGDLKPEEWQMISDCQGLSIKILKSFAIARTES